MDFTERSNIAHKFLETEGSNSPSILSALLLCGGIVLAPQAVAVPAKMYSIDFNSIHGTVKLYDFSDRYTTKLVKRETRANMVKRLRELRELYLKTGGEMLSQSQILDEIKEVRGE